jgi:hypothetical protein
MTARRAILCVAPLWTAAMVYAQSADVIGRLTAPAATPAAASQQAGSLPDRQESIRERLNRLESQMLQLSRVLAESEPDKAQRMRDGLDQIGRRQMKARVEQIIRELRAAHFGEADQGQAQFLADLESLLSLLTNPMNDIDQRRERRRRLQKQQRAVRALIDEQANQLRRTQAAGRGAESSDASGNADDEPKSGDALRQVEQSQRGIQRKAEDLQREMRKDAEPDTPAPGSEPMGRATESMGRSADALGQGQPQNAEQQQQEALEQLQEASDELDDALRQVRREELEETLTALEARLRSLLERQRMVRDTAEALSSKDPAAWTRSEQLQLGEAAQSQQEQTEEARSVHRILVDEGSTILLPDLMEQLIAEMHSVAERLSRSDVGEPTRSSIDEIIATLAEVLAAIEARRDQTLEASSPEGGNGAGNVAPDSALLPGSAELKLLRSAQARVNERTARLAQPDDADKPAATAELAQLSARQRYLADLARRMDERK